MKNFGFTLVELLVAASVFTVIATAVAGLFAQALDIQRRAVGIQSIQENAQYAMEVISREVRVSTITSGDSACGSMISIQHPVNGAVTYSFDALSGTINRNGQSITSSGVSVKSFKFCVSGSGADGVQARVVMPMTIESAAGGQSTRVSASLQTMVVSRDLSTDLSI